MFVRPRFRSYTKDRPGSTDSNFKHIKFSFSYKPRPNLFFVLLVFFCPGAFLCTWMRSFVHFPKSLHAPSSSIFCWGESSVLKMLHFLFFPEREDDNDIRDLLVCTSASPLRIRAHSCVCRYIVVFCFLISILRVHDIAPNWNLDSE